MASQTNKDSPEAVETRGTKTDPTDAKKGPGRAARAASRSKKAAATRSPAAKRTTSGRRTVAGTTAKAGQAESRAVSASNKGAQAPTKPSRKASATGKQTATGAKKATSGRNSGTKSAGASATRTPARTKAPTAKTTATKPSGVSKASAVQAPTRSGTKSPRKASGTGKQTATGAKKATSGGKSGTKPARASASPTAKRTSAKARGAQTPTRPEEGPDPKARKAAAHPVVVKRAPLPGPEIKRAPKKSVEKTTTHEKLESAEQKQVEDWRRPLDGIRVLDLSRLLPGPYASHILASFGADVIKVEKPGEGDYMREYPPQAQGFNATFLTINRGKRSIALDLSKPAGKDLFRALVQRSDVVLDGFRPGFMNELGIGYEQLRGLNPKIIYAALTGYGQTGPRAQRAGHDLNYMALSGMLDLLGAADGRPLVPGVQIADIAAGALPTVIGILLALQHRAKSKLGQMVDISMFDSLLGLMPVQVANYTATKRRPKRGHERLFGRYACYNIYPVRNGRFMAVAALEPESWAALCTAIEREDLIPDQYVEGDPQKVLIADLTRIFQKKQVDEWMEIFGELDTCVTEVREISRSVQDDTVAQRGLITPVRGKDGEVYEQLGVFPKLSEAPGYIAGDAPGRGEHTRQILKSLKYTGKQIDELLAAMVVEEPDSSADGGSA